MIASALSRTTADCGFIWYVRVASEPSAMNTFAYEPAPTSMTLAAERDWHWCRRSTIVPASRALLAWHAVVQTTLRSVPGDIVEAGVWRGGLSCFMARTQARSHTRRRVWLFDTFDGMVAPTDRDDRKSRGLFAAFKNGTLVDRACGVFDGRWVRHRAATQLQRIEERLELASLRRQHLAVLPRQIPRLAVEGCRHASRRAVVEPKASRWRRQHEHETQHHLSPAVARRARVVARAR